ncbi:redoxin domain-containing protein [Reichenbachiella ulvae]|uniref:Redoxin domain-containing protein n=1 Tax=Reichenbachiella ulvae TaxID=2980104 RepID=A0ABT3CS36_9BACT|nr:redoxin domain-containing protein [Reichenbachiella ulvae]MCV9386516.1 redoxin domain-containing protein [Reichenbachiella ulvae]
MKKALFLILSSILISLTSFAQSVGSAAPDFSLSYLSGGTFHLSDHKGKVVFLFIFGNQCPHCRSNGPNTESGIYEVYKSNPNFVAVGIDVWDGNASLVADFQDRTGITYPLCLNGSAIEDLYNTTYDRMIVIDKDGIIRFKDNAQATSAVVSSASEVIAYYLADISDDGMGMDMVLSTNQKLSFNLYPNPTNQSQINVSSTELIENEGEFLLYDLAGKLQYSTPLSSDPTGIQQINLEASLKGPYIASLTIGDQHFNQRIFITQ